MTVIRRALIISFVERYGLVALALVSNVLVARLLTPAEIGLYSVSLAVIGIGQVVRDFGIGSYLIQEKKLTDAHIRTAFGVSLIIGFGLFGIFLMGAPHISRFYNNEDMSELIKLISLNFLLLPFCSISVSLLRREMQFGRLMFVNWTGGVVGFIVTIHSALTGHGAESPAFGAIASNVSIGITSWLVRKGHKVLLPGFSEWRSIVRFGGQSSLAAIVTSIAIDINDLVVGKVMDFTAVAMMSRAQGLMNLFHRDTMLAIRNVAFPAFAKAYREGENLEERYIKSVAAVTAVAWPFYGFIALYPLEILRLMFGPQWDAAAELVPIFSLAGAIASTFTLIPSVVLATGRVSITTKVELILQPVRAGLIISAAIFYKTILACAIGFLIAFSLAVPLFYYFKAKCIQNNLKSLLKELWLSAKITTFCLALPAGFAYYLTHKGAQSANLWHLFGLGCLTGLMWLIALFLFKHPLAAALSFQKTAAKHPFSA